MVKVTTNYAVAPGGYLAEWIEDNHLTQGEVATRLTCSRKQVNEVVNGHAPITPDFALRLERLTGIPSHAWLRYESQYRSDLARLGDERALADHADHIHPKAVRYLRSLGVLSATKSKPGKMVAEFLQFHGCGTWEAYLEVHQSANKGDYSLAALTEGSRRRDELDPTILTSWLRAGELNEAFEVGRKYQFTPEELQSLLPALKARAARPDASLLRDLASMLADVGVVYMVVPAPSGLPLHGVTRWIGKSVPVIQQTGRRNKDGYLIWAFFHELGHVLNDPRGEMHLEFSTQKKRDSAAEQRANQFARDTLFGASGMGQFRGLRTDAEIKAAAHRAGVAPGVVVEQLHRTRQLPYNHGNQLCVDLSGTFDPGSGAN